MMRIFVAIVIAACAHGTQDLGAIGTRTSLRGRISDKPREHMTKHVPGKRLAYFDYAHGRQTVVYWAVPPTCSGEIKITGTVIEISGPSKGRHGGTHRELHVDVDTARCVDD